MREYLPFVIAVVIMQAGFMLTARIAPTSSFLALGLVVTAIVTALAGVLSARLLWGRPASKTVQIS